MSPLIPFNVFNYFMGITGVRVFKYSVGGLGMIPGTAVYVYFGSTISDLASVAAGKFEGGWLRIVLMVVGSVLAFLAVVYVSWMAKREINKVLKK